MIFRIKLKKPNLTFERDWLRQPLNLTLGAMQNLPIFSVWPVAVFAAGSAAGYGVVASRFVVVLLELPVRLFSLAASFSVSRSSLLRSPLRLAPPVFSCGSFAPFCLPRSVAVLASNLTVKRDGREAARPLPQR